MKVYCEHSAISPALRALQRDGKITLVHFPYDPDSRSAAHREVATPSAAQIRDLNLPFKDAPGTFDDYTGSDKLSQIRGLLGPEHRRDALHVDSAHKTGCRAFVTPDSDILEHRMVLEVLLGIRFFHPNADEAALVAFLDPKDGAT